MNFGRRMIKVIKRKYLKLESPRLGRREKIKKIKVKIKDNGD